jgi:hypothetical protein
MDPSQAAGLTLRPTAMLPRVFPGLNPSDPLYNTLSALPVGQWAMLGGKGTVQSTANRIGKFYNKAGMQQSIPSTDKLLGNFAKGKGIEDMFQGVKAGRGDQESYMSPGYVYGQEPMPLGEATQAAGSLLDAALYAEPLGVRMKYGSAPGGWGSFQLDKWASKAVKKPAGKGKPVYKAVGRRLFG